MDDFEVGMEEHPVPSEISPLADPVNKFTVSLFHRLSADAGQENVFASPLSVSTCLSMLMLGAKQNSLKQLLKGMSLDSIDESSVHSLFQKLITGRIRNDERIKLANYVLINRESDENAILQKYKSDLQSQYSAKLDDVDFGTESKQILSTVNNWVKENTGGMIDSILTKEPTADTRLILLNAIYFAGRWKKPFDKCNTEKMTFYNRGSGEIETDFMSKYQMSFPYGEEVISGEKCQIIELAYDDDSTSMIVILPEQRDGLNRMMTSDSILYDLTNVLSNESTTSLFDTTLDLFLPKFEFGMESELNKTLVELGISDIFLQGVADLSGIRGSRDLVVSLVKHKAVVKVDEEGTVAAAVTAMVVMMCCAPMITKRIEFKADHPFLFAIKDKRTGIVLFIGKLESF